MKNSKPLFVPEKDLNNDYPDHKTATEATKSQDLNVSQSKNPTNASSELFIRISFRTSGTPTALLSLSGIIVKANLELLRSAFTECLTQQKNTIILNLQKVISINRDGWKCIIAEQKRIQHRNAALLLCGLTPEMKADVALLSARHNDSIKIFPTVLECQKEILLFQKYQKDKEPPKTVPALPVDQKKHIKDHSLNTEPQHEHMTEKTGTPIEGKISAIISRYGPCSVIQILSHLHSAEYSYQKISLLGLIRILDEMDLNSVEKRERFFRSA